MSRLLALSKESLMSKDHQNKKTRRRFQELDKITVADFIQVDFIQTNIGRLSFNDDFRNREIQEAIEKAIAPILIKRAQELSKSD